jgi:hypothetical protein
MNLTRMVALAVVPAAAAALSLTGCGRSHPPASHPVPQNGCRALARWENSSGTDDMLGGPPGTKIIRVCPTTVWRRYQ